MTATNWPASRTYTGFIQRGSAVKPVGTRNDS
jgi:hypothetical protein